MSNGIEHVAVNTDPATGELVASSSLGNAGVVVEVARANNRETLENQVSQWYAVRKLMQAKRATGVPMPPEQS